MMKLNYRDIKDAAQSFTAPQRQPGQSSSTQSETHPGNSAIIGENITIEGTIRGSANLVIQGRLKGAIDLQGHKCTVGPRGNVEADIQAENVVISGRMAGNISARGKVEITRDADFAGQIKAQRISVEDGAYLKATIELDRADRKKPPPPKGPIEAIQLSPQNQKANTGTEVKK